VSRTATYWLHYVASARGLYAQEGLAVEPLETGSTAGGVAALEAGRVEVAGNCPDHLVAAVERGAALVVVGGVVDRPAAVIVASPAFSRVEDLRGARVAFTETVGGTSSLLRSILRRHGLAAGDYAPVIIAGTPAQAEALRHGAVDAALLTQPFEARLLAEGCRLLGAASDYWSAYAFTTLNVRREWAEEHAAELASFFRATLRAGRWLFDPTNAAAAQQILATATGLRANDVLATYRRYVEVGGVLAPEAEISGEGMRAVLDVMREEQLLAVAPAADWYLDASYWSEARRSLSG
jgi:ABC-type nitrate/sulfonate/bicarbonate transport system substrate-binding protein